MHLVTFCSVAHFLPSWSLTSTQFHPKTFQKALSFTSECALIEATMLFLRRTLVFPKYISGKYRAGPHPYRSQIIASQSGTPFIKGYHLSQACFFVRCQKTRCIPYKSLGSFLLCSGLQGLSPLPYHKMHISLFYWSFYIWIFHFKLSEILWGSSWGINNKLIKEFMIKEQIESFTLSFC